MADKDFRGRKSLSCPFPKRVIHQGASVMLEPFDEKHATELWAAALDADQSWSYLRYGPFSSFDQLRENVCDLAAHSDQPFWAVRPYSTNKAEGWLSLCDIYPNDAAIEIGSIWFSPKRQRTRASTEAIFLLMKHAFDDLGYQRLVWRCLAQNSASRRVADRYGFVYEGIWRKAASFKNMQSDVVWHSIIVEEWPRLKTALSAWLDESNFDRSGKAISRLEDSR